MGGYYDHEHHIYSGKGKIYKFSSNQEKEYFELVKKLEFLHGNNNWEHGYCTTKKTFLNFGNTIVVFLMEPLVQEITIYDAYQNGEDDYRKEYSDVQISQGNQNWIFVKNGKEITKEEFQDSNKGGNILESMVRTHDLLVSFSTRSIYNIENGKLRNFYYNSLKDFKEVIKDKKDNYCFTERKYKKLIIENGPIEDSDESDSE